MEKRMPKFAASVLLMLSLFTVTFTLKAFSQTGEERVAGSIRLDKPCDKQGPPSRRITSTHRCDYTNGCVETWAIVSIYDPCGNKIGWEEVDRKMTCPPAVDSDVLIDKTQTFVGGKCSEEVVK
jgi:hypothetical protein